MTTRRKFLTGLLGTTMLVPNTVLDRPVFGWDRPLFDYRGTYGFKREVLLAAGDKNFNAGAELIRNELERLARYDYA